ncbi:MAG TPA: SCO family protein [Microthrixaceae bacterium]|nr:SCO family protein [Microthrixaceae bacterium]
MATENHPRFASTPRTRRQMLKSSMSLTGAAVLGATAFGSGVLSGCSRSTASDVDVNQSPAAALGLHEDAILVGPLDKPTLTWTDHNSEPYNIAEATAGRTTLMFFGYTSCPDQCPVYLNNMAAAIDTLEASARAVNVLFVGVDTARDTPEVMKNYLESKDRNFLGLTASPAEIDGVLASLALPSVSFPDGTEGNYTVGHPLQCVAFTRDNLCHVMYPYDLRQSEWADQLKVLSTIEWPAEES